MKKQSLMMSVILLVVWHIAALFFQNDILLPGPVDVLNSMIIHLQREDFLLILLSTSYRTLAGCLISLCAAGFLGVAGGINPTFKMWFSPIHQLIKTIPNITYMILILIWLGQEKSVTVIVFFILFPVFYAEFLYQTEIIQNQIKDLLQIYPVTRTEKWLKIILPMLLPEIFNALKTGIGMGFKVCVMAEILGQVKSGIGRQMNIGRLNLEIASVFGWTIWLLLISAFLQGLVTFVQKITCEKTAKSVQL